MTSDDRTDILLYTRLKAMTVAMQLNAPTQLFPITILAV